jgi:hypothetical protein
VETTLNPNLSPAVTHQPSLLGGAENMKLLFDDTMAALSRARTVAQSHDNAWETLRFTTASDAQVVKHLAQLNFVAAGQTGATENQQSVTPIRTGAADAQNQQPAGAVYPPIRNVDQSGSTATAGIQAAQEQIAANVAALSDVVTKLADALSAVIVTAAGGASTPSQTTTKPAA